ncbi:MAG: hypothetical protein JWR37_3360 [Mycobacterium sp.]|jgi:hypothetical protein|nr:hypothetical protein [Mycobacterium sp.]
MKAKDSFTYDIAERADHLEVRGVSGRDIVEALNLFDKVRTVQADHAATNRHDLVHALMAGNVPLTPPATVAQAQRLATHRDALLATPVLTHRSLRELRGDARESSTRTWLSRRRDARALFTISHNGRTLIPAFQLDDNGEPRPELQPILDALIDAGVQGWPLWTWLTSPTNLLSGETPERLARTAPQRVLRAAKRFATATAA